METVISHQILLVENSMFKKQTPFKDKSLKFHLVQNCSFWLTLARRFFSKLLVETSMGLKNDHTRYWEHVVVDLPDQVSWLENSS